MSLGPRESSYTVVMGDTLSGISSRLGHDMSDLVKVNGLSDPNRLAVGQVLKLPGAAAPAGTDGYTVVAGDTLSGIAERLGLDLMDLIAANQLSDPNRLTIGQVLRLPGTATPVPDQRSTPGPGEPIGGLQILFVDKLLRAIPGLEFVLESSSGVLAQGATNAHGLTTRVQDFRVGEQLTLSVRRAQGGLKEILTTIAGRGERIITAYSPAILLNTSTEEHEGEPGDERTPEGHPVILVDQQEVVLDFLGEDSGERIDDSDYREAAVTLACEVAAIKAVAQAETGSMGSYFNLRNWDSVPAILYERHYFHRLTGGAYDVSHPDISNRRAGAGGTWSEQYRKLLRAYALDEEAALKSASWSKFQIMGANHVAAGYDDVRDMVRAVSVTEKNHLRMFVSFISADPVLVRSIRSKDWLSFARRYNGPAQNGYDLTMRQNYDAFVRAGANND